MKDLPATWRLSTLACVTGATDIFLDDLAWENRTYNTVKAYSQSKLANILFAKELAVKLEGKKTEQQQ